MSVLPSPVIVARDRDIAGLSPGPTSVGVRRAARQDVPGSVCRPPHRDVRLAVAVIVARDRDVPGLSPGPTSVGVRRAARQDVPVSVCRPPHRDIGLAVAVTVARDRDIAGLSPGPTSVGVRRAARQDVPVSRLQAATPRYRSCRRRRSQRGRSDRRRCPIAWRCKPAGVMFESVYQKFEPGR